ncbi:preprotein translocase subunit YajC [bacterium]|nr:preprotein translocase subunit YajC [bacterium]MBU1754364.1 preprotein translocase subunit YajC [bacterium]
MIAFVIGLAYADSAAPACPPAGVGGGIGSMVPLLLIFVVFYFLLIRPQQKERKVHKEMLKNLVKGDNVITASGIHGTIVEVQDDICKIKVAQNVIMDFSKSTVTLKKNQIDATKPQAK